MSLLLVFIPVITAKLLAVIWDGKYRWIDRAITVGIKPEVKNDLVSSVSFGNHFFALVSQVLNVSKIVMLPSVKILSITVCFACEDIVLLTEPISWKIVW
jgi:hypothetical protein